MVRPFPGNVLSDTVRCASRRLGYAPLRTTPGFSKGLKDFDDVKHPYTYDIRNTYLRVRATIGRHSTLGGTISCGVNPADRTATQRMHLHTYLQYNKHYFTAYVSLSYITKYTRAHMRTYKGLQYSYLQVSTWFLQTIDSRSILLKDA